MRFEKFIALRYLHGKRKTRFIGLITFISIAGVSVGVIALIVVMSVMTGFDNALRESIIGNRAHLVVQDYWKPIADPGPIIKRLESYPEVVAASPFYDIKGLLRTMPRSEFDDLPRREEPVMLIGVDPELESKVTLLAENLTHDNGRKYGRGKLPTGDKEIVLGYVLADKLRVTVGDSILVLTANERTSFFGGSKPTKMPLKVCGISEAQMYEYDSLAAFVNLETAAKLCGRDAVDGVHAKLVDPFAAKTVARRAQDELGLRVSTWYENQQAFFDALKQEKFALFVILVFIVLVAAFNITSTLIMLVMEKRRDIGILRTIGVSGPSILLTFMLEGLFIGVGGTILGVVTGTLLAHYLNPVAEWIAKLFHIDLFNSQIYYFDRIPVDVVPQDIMWISICAVVLTFLSTLYPAWSATRVNPVEALRYE